MVVLFSTTAEPPADEANDVRRPFVEDAEQTVLLSDAFIGFLYCTC